MIDTGETNAGRGRKRCWGREKRQKGGRSGELERPALGARAVPSPSCAWGQHRGQESIDVVSEPLEVHHAASAEREEEVMEEGQKVSAIQGRSRRRKLEAQERGRVPGGGQCSVVATGRSSR